MFSSVKKIKTEMFATYITIINILSYAFVHPSIHLMSNTARSWGYTEVNTRWPQGDYNLARVTKRWPSVMFVTKGKQPNLDLQTLVFPSHAKVKWARKKKSEFVHRGERVQRRWCWMRLQRQADSAWCMKRIFNFEQGMIQCSFLNLKA